MEYPLIYDKNLVQIYRINERVYYRVGDLDRRRQCNGGFILLDDCTVAVDVPSAEGACEMLRESMELFGRPVRYAILTHAHPDHDLGLPVFAGAGDITLFASRTARAELEAQGIAYPARFIGIDGAARLRLEGVELVLERVGVTAHSPWDMLAYLPAFGVMFTGDLVACEPVLYLESCCLQSWIGVLKELRQREVPVLARGHGGCSGSDYLGREIAYLSALSGINRYMRTHLAVREEDVRDDYMGEVLRRLCEKGDPDAKLLFETAGEAAYYQLTQFYRYRVAP